MVYTLWVSATPQENYRYQERDKVARKSISASRVHYNLGEKYTHHKNRHMDIFETHYFVLNKYLLSAVGCWPYQSVLKNRNV